MKGSWKTSLAGWILIGAGALGLIADIIQKQGFPNTIMEGLTFATTFGAGIAALVAKDYNVSMSQHPAAPAVVSDAAMATPNPAATVQP